MRITFCTLIIAGLSFTAHSTQAQDCTTTADCAQKMLAAVEELRATDANLADELSSLAIAMTAAAAANAVESANALAQAMAHADARIAAIGKGSDSTPNWGNGTSAKCSRGAYMVGAKVNVATGGNAGALYTNIAPICRSFK
jgi:hypothetical protein